MYASSLFPCACGLCVFAFPTTPEDALGRSVWECCRCHRQFVYRPIRPGLPEEADDTEDVDLDLGAGGGPGFVMEF